MQIDNGADYILSIKENPKTLYNNVKLYLYDIYRKKELFEAENYYKSPKKRHGKIEIRENWLVKQ